MSKVSGRPRSRVSGTHLKATKKILRKRKKRNQVRRLRGQAPLPLKAFAGHSKREYQTYLKDKREREEQQAYGPTSIADVHQKKKKEAKKEGPPKFREGGTFGFGRHMTGKEPEYERFAEQIDRSDSEPEPLSDEEEDMIESMMNPPTVNDLKAQNQQIEGQIEKHQTELEKLQKADPEFYRHLRETEGNLLSFGDRDQFDLGDLGDLDDVVTAMQNDKNKQTRREIEGEVESESEEEEEELDDDDAAKFMEEEDDNKNDSDDDAKDELIPDDPEAMEDDDVAQFMDEDGDEDDEEEDISNEDDVDGMEVDVDDEQRFADEAENETITKMAAQGETEAFGLFAEYTISRVEQMINRVESSTDHKCLGAILSAFSRFVEYMLSAEAEIAQAADKKKKSKSSIMVANNPGFKLLLKWCISQMGEKVKHILKITDRQNHLPRALQQNGRFKLLRTKFAQYFKFLFGFFKNIMDDQMQRLFLQHCRQMVCLILSMNQTTLKLYLRKATKLWSTGKPNVRIDAFMFLHECAKRMHPEKVSYPREQMKTPQPEAYGPDPNQNAPDAPALGQRDLQLLLKYMYQSFVTVCKRVSDSTMPGINFMINCMAEMYSLNLVIAYQDAFKRLRAVAFHVKQAIQTMAKQQSRSISTKEIRAHKLKREKQETVQSVYNWRFINIIRMWSKVLQSHAADQRSDLHLLHYPFIQICCSVLTLVSSATYDPGRLKVMQALCDLIAACQKSPVLSRRIYVPLAPYLLSIINNPAFTKRTKEQRIKQEQDNKAKQKKDKKPKKRWGKHKKGKGDEEKKENKETEEERIKRQHDEEQAKKQKERAREFNLLHKITIQEKDFSTEYLHRSLMGEAIRLLVIYFGHYSYSIAFPEIAFPTVLFLKDFVQNSAVDADLRGMAKLLSTKLKENSMWITSKRKSVQFSPKDFKQVNMFLARERHQRTSPLTKFVDTAAFKAIMEYKEKSDVDEEKLLREAKKKLEREEKRKEKREKKKKGKELRREQQEQMLKEKKKAKYEAQKRHKEEQEVGKMKAQYEKDAKVGTMEIPELGDVVKDFELSD